MVTLQDAANAAIVGGLSLSVALNVYQYWSKRRDLSRGVVGSITREVQDVRIRAASSDWPAWFGSFNGFRQLQKSLPRRVREEVQGFVSLCEQYDEIQRRAEDRVKLAVYESVSKCPGLRRTPMESVVVKEPNKWVVYGGHGRSVKDTLEEALIDAVAVPLLRRESVRWSWLRDREREFTDQLLQVTNEATVNALLERAENLLKNESSLDEMRRLRARIQTYPFRLLRIS